MWSRADIFHTLTPRMLGRGVVFKPRCQSLFLNDLPFQCPCLWSPLVSLVCLPPRFPPHLLAAGGTSQPCTVSPRTETQHPWPCQQHRSRRLSCSFVFCPLWHLQKIHQLATTCPHALAHPSHRAFNLGTTASLFARKRHLMTNRCYFKITNKNIVFGTSLLGKSEN